MNFDRLLDFAKLAAIAQIRSSHTKALELIPAATRSVRKRPEANGGRPGGFEEAEISGGQTLTVLSARIVCADRSAINLWNDMDDVIDGYERQRGDRPYNSMTSENSGLRRRKCTMRSDRPLASKSSNLDFGRSMALLGRLFFARHQF